MKFQILGLKTQGQILDAHPTQEKKENKRKKLFSRRCKGGLKGRGGT